MKAQSKRDHKRKIMEFLNLMLTGKLNTKFILMKSLNFIYRLPENIIGPDFLEKQDDDSLKSCMICVEEYVVGDKTRTMPCFHFFHKHCIDMWL
jgi:hypothetical protein